MEIRTSPKSPLVPSSTSPDWRNAMQTAIRSGVELCRRLHLPKSFEAAAARAEKLFPVFAPLSYVRRMTPRDPADPLLRQVLPLEEEFDEVVGFSPDPVGDGAATIGPRLLQKYTGRVLMLTTGTCAVHCRYCFRREFEYGGKLSQLTDLKSCVEKIRDDTSVHEVLLSGGDPLTLSDGVLTTLSDQLADVPHLRRLRIHTRLPIVIPERVNDSLLHWLTQTRLTPFIVVHANHAHELDDRVARSLTSLVDSGIPVLNQAVLLRGVNDSIEALTDLCERLVDLRVTPYYLHQLDRVTGAAHFEVPIDRGLRLAEQLRAALPGYAVPRYVSEVPGEQSKRILA